MSKQTSIYDMHIKYQGKMVDYEGYSLPVFYSEGIVSEHLAVRNSLGIFDVSHMGEFMLEGENVADFLNYVLTIDVHKMQDNQVKYSMLLNAEGFVIDDLLVYKFSYKSFMLVVNAANIIVDYEHINQLISDDIGFFNVSDKVSMIAIQGKNAVSVFNDLNCSNILDLKYYSFNEVQLFNKQVVVSRTGYTGEDGFEIYSKNEDALEIYQKLMEFGEKYQIKTCGLASRDSLRFEASMPLYGHEISLNINPLEANLGFAIDFSKNDFIGKSALLNDQSRKIIALHLESKLSARSNCLVYQNDREVGFVTSASFCPYLNGSYANALVNINEIDINEKFTVEIRNKYIEAIHTKLPLYKRKK